MIYLDHNATTPVRPEVREAMLPYLGPEFGNPNSAYFLGQRARKAVEEARGQVAALIGAKDASEIVFTSCGTESDVMAVSGAAWAAFDESREKRRGVLTSLVEHDAVRGIVSWLARRGFKISWAAVDAAGLIDAKFWTQAITETLGSQLAVVSIMHANNEVGTLQPIAEIAAACRGQGVLFHTDAIQSAGKVAVDVAALGVDLLSLSGHKLGASKGVGALYIRKGVKLAPTLTGHQEKNRRGGTENVAGIVGFGAACALALAENHGERLEGLRQRLIEGASRIPDSRLNGHPTLRLPHCAHFSFKGIDGHSLVVALDQKGFCVSSGPACSSGATEPSHVLTAMGVERDYAAGSLRVSLGASNTAAEVDAFLAALAAAVAGLRQSSLSSTRHER